MFSELFLIFSMAGNVFVPLPHRSTQNLSEGSYPVGVGRHPSNPSLLERPAGSAGEEERYYQNINFHQGPQDPRMGSTRTRPAQLLPLGSPSNQPEQPEQARPEARPDHRPASAFLQREEALTHRQDLQRPASQRDIRADAKMIEMTEEVRRREERARLNNHPSSLGPAHQTRPSPHQPAHRAPAGFPHHLSGPFSPDNYPGGPQGYPAQHPNYPPQNHPLSPMAGHHQPPHHGHPQYSPHGQNMPDKLPPPTAPKPKPPGGPASEAPEKPMRQFGYEGSAADGPPRPPPPEDGYRDSPPPPPPPTSTHPLLQSSRPASSVGFAGQLSTKSAFNKTSPWDREQKELVSVVFSCQHPFLCNMINSHFTKNS